MIWCAVPEHARFSYYGDPEKTAAAWRGDSFTVGDVGRLDDDGYLFLEGRREDLIISGGVNVYPLEVEQILGEHPGVTDVAVYAVDDPEWGQRVCAAVVGDASRGRADGVRARAPGAAEAAEDLGLPRRTPPDPDREGPPGPAQQANANVSISAVIRDLDTTASGVQSAIALEALVSAAFILINSKVGDLIGRKRAYVLGLLAYALGALAMTLAQSLTAIVIFWAIIGGLGRLLAPAGDAVADPRQLHGRSPEAGVRAGRCLGGDRGRDRAAARGVRHDLPVVAGRLRAGGPDHRDRAEPDRVGA